MPCDDSRLVNVSCAAISHTLMKRFFVAGQRGLPICDMSLYFFFYFKTKLWYFSVMAFFSIPDPITCDISLTTGNINLSEYQPAIVCPSSVDVHWFISVSLRIKKISLGFHQTTALYLLITFFSFSS
jgi:hypothetical protein